MKVLAEKFEIEKSLPFLENSKWGVQNDKQDQDTSFIYYCQRLGQVMDLALSNNVDLGYAIHRWYNHHCSKWVEQMFCEFGAVAYEDEKSHDTDLTIEGVPFDIKLSVISNSYEGDQDLKTRANKDAYIKWLKANASQESRKHTSNKIFVICDSMKDKCDFLRMADKIIGFLDYFKKNIAKYEGQEICELIYIPKKES